MSDPDEREHGGGRPRGSPEAERFDPPVRATRWLAPADVGWDAFVREVGARAQLDPAGLARVVHHGGIWLDAHPVALDAPPATVRAGVHVAVYALAYEPEPVPLPDDLILHDAGGVVAANKPAWLPVQGTRASQRISLEVELRARLDCPGLRAAHRLDRQTSGVVLFARDSERAAFLGKALQDRRVERTYLALVSPAPKEDRWTVRGELGPAKTPPRFRFELRAARCARHQAERDRIQSAGPQRSASARRVPPADGAHAPAARAPRRGRNADLWRRSLRPAVPGGRADERRARAAPRREPAREAGRARPGGGADGAAASRLRVRRPQPMKNAFSLFPSRSRK